jgi:phosphatidate cytidylyltransferase
MLKQRLIFGTLMSIFFIGVLLLDGYINLPAGFSASGIPTQATILCILVAVLIVLGHLELSNLAAARGLTIFRPFAVLCSVALATTWYWPQLFNIAVDKYLASAATAAVLGLFLLQYIYFGTSGVLSNCGANLFSIFYLGLLPAFFVLLRIEKGHWPLLMLIIVIKCSDIGAYTAGSLWGRHKFSPVISPRKTWEGMGGAIVFAVAAAVLFAVISGIMPWFTAAVFAVVFAFIGQLGDLAESLIKRDAERKDASAGVPGFGGLLDILDSLLPAAPFAYLFFRFFVAQ